MIKIKQFFIFSFLGVAKYFRKVLSESEGAYKLLFVPGYESTRWQIGKWKAWQVFESAKKTSAGLPGFFTKTGWGKNLYVRLGRGFNRYPTYGKRVLY